LAEKQLRTEFQTLAIDAARDAEAPWRSPGLHNTFHYVAAVPAAATLATPATPRPPLSASKTVIDPQPLKTVIFVMASTAVYALPAVIEASPVDRPRKIFNMITDIATSGLAAGLSIKAAAAIKEALIFFFCRCEHIAANCTAAPTVTKTLAQFVAVRPTSLNFSFSSSLRRQGEPKWHSCSSHYPRI